MPSRFLPGNSDYLIFQRDRSSEKTLLHQFSLNSRIGKQEMFHVFDASRESRTENQEWMILSCFLHSFEFNINLVEILFSILFFVKLCRLNSW